MPTILRATDHSGSVQGVAFNFEDMAARAGEYLDRVRAQAAAILQQARQDAEAIRQAAEAEGRRSGEAQVEKLVERQLAGQLATLLPALRKAIADIGHAKQDWLNHWEETGVGTACSIARRLVGRELAHRPEIALERIRESLELAAGSARLRIELNPADHAALGPQIETLVAELAPLAEAELAAHPEITPGGCRIETQFGVIDQQVETQLGRIMEELAG
jgi:flagellar assembly protein FliH